MAGYNLKRSSLQMLMNAVYRDLHISVVVFSDLTSADSLHDLQPGELPCEQTTTCQSLWPHSDHQPCFCGVLIACYDTQTTSLMPSPTRSAEIKPDLTPLRRTSASSSEALSPLILNGEASIRTAVV